MNDTPPDHIGDPNKMVSDHLPDPGKKVEATPLPKIQRDGITIFKRYPGDASAWYYKFAHRGVQRMVKLTNNATESMKRARAIRSTTLAHKLEAVDQIVDALRERRPSSPLAAIFDRYQKNAPAATGVGSHTVRDNLQAIRNLIRRALEQPDLPDAAVEAMPSSTVSPALLEKYKRLLLAAAGENKIQQDRTAVTCNSTLRQVRSLFTKKLPADFYEGLILPDVEALRDVRLLPEARDGFAMPADSLLDKVRAAAPALKLADPNAYLIYLLAMVTGLRAGEIAASRQHWIETHVVKPPAGAPPGTAATTTLLLRVQTEEDFRPKSKQQRLVPISPAVHAEIQELVITTLPGHPDYVLRGSPTERKDQAFRRFNAWLTNLGWDRLKKAHELRKVFGSHVAHQAGLRAAQEMLGHAQYATTERYYVGQVEVPIYSIPDHTAAPPAHLPEATGNASATVKQA